MEFRASSLAASLCLLLLVPPFFLGVIAKTKALFAGRKGPPIFQAYFDIIKLFRKGTVVSRTSSWISRLAPALVFCAIFFAGLFLPPGLPPPFSFMGDLILFVYLLALARFALVLMAWDAGSSFEGMGASREAAFGALSELSFLLGLVILTLVSGSASLGGMFQWRGTHTAFQPAVVILFVIFFFVLLAENARMPVDDPATHLELTMIHEVMILDLGGPDLGLVLYGSAIKLFVFMALVVSVIWPQGGGVGIFLLKITGLAVLIGVVESVLARVRLIRIPHLLAANFVLTALALLVILFGAAGPPAR